jgi:hypothetical protein
MVLIVQNRMKRIIDNTMSTEERLAQFLKESKDWQRKTTSIRGIFLLKIPRFKTSAAAESVAIEINPVNAATGSATKKRGIVIRSTSELELIKGILTDPKLAELAKKIDEVNPPEIKRSAKAKTGNDSDIIEI